MTTPWDFVHRAHRPITMGTTHVIASGHYLATQAGYQILENGGNAIDAGIAAGICLNVLEGQQCSFSGVAPIMIRMASGEIVTIDGLGVWPQAADLAFFKARGDKVVPEGILQTVVPGAPDAWLTALEKFGTMRFGDVAKAAIDFARHGFPIHPELAFNIEYLKDDFPPGTEAERIFRPHGVTPKTGQILTQQDLARSLQYMADEESAAGGDRAASIAAARRAFYQGDIAQAIARHQKDNGGLLTLADMAAYRVTIEAPLSVEFMGTQVYACGPWCQGPQLLQQLAILKDTDLAALGHNSVDFIHLITEVVKLTAADRESYYGDPKFIDVPMKELLSAAYAVGRLENVDRNRAFPDMPAAGDIPGWSLPELERNTSVEDGKASFKGRDTSYVCAVDRHGNAFSATPSDGLIRSSPIVPGLGFGPSSRGVQSRLDPHHPSRVEPGKRPRLTPNPAMAVRSDEFVMPFGTPGGDHQTQAMLQFLLNVLVFGKDMQEAVELPRFYSHSFPDSFAPHGYVPGLLRLEKPIDDSVADALTLKGHLADWWPAHLWPKTSVCAIRHDLATGLKSGGADNRRTATAQGR